MKVNKKILTIGGALSIGLLPLAVVSCGTNKETTYFESENFRISSKGEMMGFADENFNHRGPLEIKEKYNGVTIKHIAESAFKDQTGIDEVILPKTLVSIGGGAFRDIKSPVIYPSDQNIDEPVLWDLSHLVNLEYIGGSFQGNDIEFPVVVQQSTTLNLSGLSKLKSIGGYRAFHNRGISSIDFNGLNSFETIGESSFSTNRLTSINIPNSVTTIRDNAFSGNQLTSIDIPNSVTTIGEGAFGSNQLTSINLPNSITTISKGVFSFNQLSSIDIPDSVTSIGEGAFGSNQLTSIDIPDSVTSIGGGQFGAFESNKLTSINIPNSVTIINDNAFKNNPFTDKSKIILPAQFNTASERLRIGITLPLDANSPINNSKIETLIPILDNKKY